jgi:hypothetical protein
LEVPWRVRASTLRLPVALPRAKGVGSSCD